MKKHTLRIILSVTLVAAVMCGCAKKPASVVVDPSGEPVVSTMPSEDVAGYGNGSMSDQATGDGSGYGMGTMGDGTVAGLNRIFFEFDQFTLTPEARDILAKNAEYMKANTGLRVRIEGHCDERGSDEYNLALGERRASATKNYMVSLGVDSDRLTIISYGEEMPLDPGRSESAWSQNRRAEFKDAR
ncbi:MAG: peptidoglycan-associated lipoprotein [Desulfuromonadaceae bacterium GWC2_58_13]|nr:MAG: peptidoglycan-associated lipoprotein [Desulfuromonadaceae bacterium GWC2_58_13]